MFGERIKTRAIQNENVYQIKGFEHFPSILEQLEIFDVRRLKIFLTLVAYLKECSSFNVVIYTARIV